MNNKRKRLIIDVTSEFHSDVKIQATKANMSISKYIILLIVDEVRKRKELICQKK